tara:strand:- start:31 stop:1017 length:987 start_codon:yes stop_codon:yes gene_type:complete
MAIPTGAIRYNTDSNKMECFNGTKWYQISVSESSPIAGRGIQFGANPNPRDEIQYFNLVTRGDAIDFGNLASGRSSTCAVSSVTRGFCCGGYYAPGEKNDIQEVIIATAGNATDFGDLTHTMARGNRGQVGSQTRGIIAGRQNYYDVIQYITMAQKGDAVDFGNLTYDQENTGGCGSPTRGILWGGEKQGSPHYVNNIEYITIASTGNAVDFGDKINNVNNVTGGGNSVRGLAAGGGPVYSNAIAMVTIATTGNAIDFGDDVSGYMGSNSQSTPIHTFFTGGYQPSPGTSTKMIRSFNIASGGTAIDWGDVSTANSGLSGCSNTHGGL